jgi:outer membrane biosynthesis protein TonB
MVFAFGAAAVAAAAVAITLHFSRQAPPQAPVVAVAPKPVPAPVVAAPKPAPVVEAPKPAPAEPAPPVAEAPKPAPVVEAAPPPPAPKEKLKQRVAEKKAARQERQLTEPPPMAYVDEQPAAVAAKPAARPAQRTASQAPAAPAFRAKVVSLDRSWGFAVVELAERGSVKVGDRLIATTTNGRRAGMVVRRVSGNLVSAVPDGRLSDDLVGASVSRN